MSRQHIGDFYKLHHGKGKLYTFTNLKASGYSKSQIYDIMAKFDKTGTVVRKSGSGRPQKLDPKKNYNSKKWRITKQAFLHEN